AGDVIYLGGEFSNLNGIPRSRLAAVDTVNGAPTSWNAGTTNQAVYALALRDTSLYAGGDFTSIGGQSRTRLATLGTSAALPTAWNPGAGGTVLSLSSSGNTITVAGNFSIAGGQSRLGIAEIDSATGDATAWHPPVENGFVHAFARFGNDVFIGGNFTNIGGMASHGLARLLPPDPNPPTVTAGTPGNTSAGEQISLTWTASDDYAIQTIDLHLSRSGPGGPWEVIAVAAPPTGSYAWKVTGPPSTGCVIRVDARDYEGNLASDVSDVFAIGNPLAVGDDIVRGLQLGAPIPNPVSRAGQIWFQAPRAGSVRVTLVDVQGREVQLLADRHVEAGRHAVSLRGDQVPPGLYFVRITGFGEQRSRRVVFIR
ncbi:MAG TPA: T9SS type A sorting domain-containing protein, partial [Candidatus Krumholzibacteria bacterium]|nr:T9SS type A sorting domain-containing protein [Candidatus Krumholzibacteria bacterium]